MSVALTFLILFTVNKVQWMKSTQSWKPCVHFQQCAESLHSSPDCWQRAADTPQCSRSVFNRSVKACFSISDCCFTSSLVPMCTMMFFTFGCAARICGIHSVTDQIHGKAACFGVLNANSFYIFNSKITHNQCVECEQIYCQTVLFFRRLVSVS